MPCLVKNNGFTLHAQRLTSIATYIRRPILPQRIGGKLVSELSFFSSFVSPLVIAGKVNACFD